MKVCWCEEAVLRLVQTSGSSFCHVKGEEAGGARCTQAYLCFPHQCWCDLASVQWAEHTLSHWHGRSDVIELACPYLIHSSQRAGEESGLSLPFPDMSEGRWREDRGSETTWNITSISSASCYSIMSPPPWLLPVFTLIWFHLFLSLAFSSLALFDKTWLEDASLFLIKKMQQFA